MARKSGHLDGDTPKRALRSTDVRPWLSTSSTPRSKHRDRAAHPHFLQRSRPGRSERATSEVEGASALTQSACGTQSGTNPERDFGLKSANRVPWERHPGPPRGCCPDTIACSLSRLEIQNLESQLSRVFIPPKFLVSNLLSHISPSKSY